MNIEPIRIRPFGRMILCLLLLILLTTAPGIVCAAPPSGPSKHPNIVFIIADDLRYDGRACNGNSYIQAPHIERLAEEGINFQNAYVTTPICSPSRARFLTGLYASAHSIYNIDTNGIGILGDRLGC